MIGRRTFLQTTGGSLAAGAFLGLSGVQRALGDCVGASLTDSALGRFQSRLAGSVIFPASANYGTARLGFNRRFDPYPTMIVRVANESDVARTIEFARAHDIRLAIRSGGHSYIGASGGTGIVLDLGGMNSVLPLGNGHFRIGAGTQLQHVYGDLLCNGGWTIPCGSCDTVGFGGITQGGGFGYLQREHGITADRVRAARVVLADGIAVDASPEGDADLLWAICGGGGGSFGVVTHFDVEAVPYSAIQVLGWYWPVAAADDALAHFVSLQESGVIPRSCTVALVFNRGSMNQSPPQCVCVLFCTGTLAEALAAKQLFVGPGGIPETPGIGFQYEASSPACDPHAVAIRDYYRAKSAMVFGQPTAGTGTLIRQWMEARVADPALGTADNAAISFLTLGGAVSDLSPTDTAFRHRSALLEVQFLGYVQNRAPASIRANESWIRGVHADVFPRLSAAGAGCYVNYADDDLTEAEWPALYWGDNYARLQATKLRVDPSNVFNGKQTVRL